MEIVFSILFIVLLCVSYIIILIEASFNVITKVHTQRIFDELQKQENEDIEKLRKLLLQPQKYLITLLLVNNVLKFIIPAIPVIYLIAERNTIPFLKDNIVLVAAVIVSIIISETIIMIIDVIARYKAKPKPKVTLLKYIFILNIFTSILGIFVSFFVIITKKIANILGIRLFEKSLLVTEEDIKALVEVGKDEGIFKEQELQIFDRLFKFDDLKVKDIMVPAVDIDKLDVESSKENVLDLVIKTKHSRIPVYKNNHENIIGILYVKDLVDHLYNDDEWNLEKILRSAIFVPEVKMINQLLKQFQKERIHLSMVVDEYGSISGLITIEDILEELVGEIEDEYDKEDNMIKVLNDGSYLIDAKISLNDLNDELNINLDGDKFESLAGYIISIYGDIPKINEKIRDDNYLYEIIYSDERKISKVRLKKSKKV